MQVEFVACSYLYVGRDLPVQGRFQDISISAVQARRRISLCNTALGSLPCMAITLTGFKELNFFLINAFGPFNLQVFPSM